ncbi:predicted protein [Nematostella vectensis]|uniref:TIR domain-containing protein n=1 Tax=Nematostella vectensis TaxID=45351 RepID=A7T2M0_NEMVE|nr:predicted protein [Nematostella vectensis]|eukprot:XP_001621895.1 hypothetical protein NEMVEDRAFT_v1g221452 [Nematostella vectensis]
MQYMNQKVNCLVIAKQYNANHIFSRKKLLQQHGSADKLTLSNCRKLTTTDIQALIEAINSGLNSVTIKNCNIIDDDTLEKLAACCPKLTDVTLNGKFKKLTERGTINFAKSCQELKLFSVVLSETDESEEQEGDEEVEWGLTDNFLSGLSENTCPTLEHFGFSGFTGVTANGLLGFLWKVSPTLASLDCSEVPIITDTECREIAGICPGLTSINFSYCNITDKGVEELCLKCHLLNHIDFCGCNELTDNAVKSIATHCKKITNLKLGWCLKITETSLEALANECLSLGHVDIRHCSVKHIPFDFIKIESLSSLQGITEIQNEIFRMLLDASLFPHLLHKVDIHITYLHAEILKLREDKVVVIPWDNYLSIASEAGLTDKADVDAATELLECRIPASTQDHGPTRTVCVNPGVLFNCLACMHNETDPREFVPRFIKAGFVDRYWPTNTKPNDWTLRSAVDDIVSKGLIREAVIPLCFQAVHLSEDEICKIITLCRNIGVLVEGAPKGSYEVELILAYYKNLSVFKRYFIPLQHKLPPDSESPNVWPKAVPEGHIQVGWRFKFPDEVSAECSTLVIAACRNYKMNSELHGYWERGLILKVGDVLVKISREAAFLDVIGRCKITHGSKQALNMTWYNLAQFFYVADTLLSNYSGLSPEIMVPIEGCSRPKHKSLFELIKDYNVEPSHLANYRWFLPPAGLNAEVHTQIPSDTSSWLATIARKSTMFVSYHSDHQDEIKLLRMSLEHSGFNCVGDWSLVGQGQDLTEKRRQSIMGSSIILAFFSPNFAYSRFANWLIYGAFGKQLSGHATCLDFDGGSGKALSHQFDQAQVLQLITHCNATLYGTGDIHPPEPPRSPEVTAQVSHDKRVESIHDSTFLSAKPDEDVVKSEQQHHQNQQVPRVEVTVASESKESIVESTKDQDAKIREMAASAVAAAVAGATAQHISKKETSPEAIKAAAAAAEVGQAVLDGDSDAAAQAVVKVARIVEETSKGSTQNNRTVQNGSVSSRPPQSSTCTIL